jgi:hypothetical protein
MRHAGLGVAIIFIIAAAFTVSHDRVDFSFLIFLCPEPRAAQRLLIKMAIFADSLSSVLLCSYSGKGITSNEQF